MKVIYDKESMKVPIYSWCEDPEEGAMEQAKNLANLPFVHKHVALMPDTHQGFGMPIGGVLATKGAVIPNAVGVDIGCGMCVIKTSLTDLDLEIRRKLMEVIRAKVPVGFAKHKEPQQSSLMPPPVSDLTEIECENALMQLGTLGGGNHFIEFQKGDDGFVYIMLHSGSRNPGKQIADYHNKIAKELNKLWMVDVPQNLAYLPTASREGKAYLIDMNWALEYAYANRMVMMYRIMDALKNVMIKYAKKNVGFDTVINIHHNYARMEHHSGENVLVHRKGATSAKADQPGIIPGSQGTKSYIVRGKGNPDSFNSCSHGAGRLMGRKQAKETLNLKEQQNILDKQGVVHSVRSVADLDEAPGAYKDIDVVMESQKDLVEVVRELTPLLVIKG